MWPKRCFLPGGYAKSRSQESHMKCPLEWHLLQNDCQQSTTHFNSQWSIFISENYLMSLTHIHNLTLVYLTTYHCSPGKEAGLLHAARSCHNSMYASAHFCTAFPFTYSNLLLSNTLISSITPFPNFGLKCPVTPLTFRGLAFCSVY